MSGRQQPIPLADMRNGGEQHRLERWGSVDSRADVFRAVDGELFPLSSGQLTFIRFAAQVCLYIENGTMVLIDEPETHLHPNLISDFVSLLDTLLMDTGSFAILATHSAYFVREVIRSQVIVLREGKDKQIEAVTPRLKTLGADIGAISFFVFSDELYGRLLRDISTRLSKGGASATKLFDRLEQDLPPEAFMYLRRELKLAPTHEIHSRSKRPR
jgi:energy-coupling factor transporter ATP-binding protein EcfA2